MSDANIAIIRNYFKDKPVLKAYLFGSYARGDAGIESDIDILVDLVSEKAVSRHVRPFIEKEKMLIYCAS
jgi:predicted nucleotidyltransferase